MPHQQPNGCAACMNIDAWQTCLCQHGAADAEGCMQAHFRTMRSSLGRARLPAEAVAAREVLSEAFGLLRPLANELRAAEQVMNVRANVIGYIGQDQALVPACEWLAQRVVSPCLCLLRCQSACIYFEPDASNTMPAGQRAAGC